MPRLENHFGQVLHAEARHRELLRAWQDEVGARLGYRLDVIGETDGRPLHLVRPTNAGPGPRLLIAATFHGEEPAGAWGVLKFLYESADLLVAAGLAFLPLVNPTGLHAATRLNWQGEDPNRGHVPGFGEAAGPSAEGRILQSRLDELLGLAANGFLTLHEDWSEDAAYLYAYEPGKNPGPGSRHMRDTLAGHFPIVDRADFAGGDLHNGIILNDLDGSFEHLLASRGVPLAIVTETPGTEPPARRIAANATLIRAFVEWQIGGRDVANQTAWTGWNDTP